jgi:hypothetical protein
VIPAVKKSRIPLIMCEPGTSPGWTLAEMNITGFFDLYGLHTPVVALSNGNNLSIPYSLSKLRSLKLVIVSRSTLLPSRV